MVKPWCNDRAIVYGSDLVHTIHCQSHLLAIDGNEYRLGLAGAHNSKNAFVVTMLARFFNITDADIKKSLVEFQGVGRRMQLLCEKPVAVFDDYAHHPREISAVLESIENRDGLLVFWEPHRISRFLTFFDEFLNAFKKYMKLERVILLPFFYASEDPSDFLLFEDKLSEMNALVGGKVNSIDNLSDFIENCENASQVIFLGAGRSSEYAHRMAELLNKS